MKRSREYMQYHNGTPESEQKSSCASNFKCLIFIKRRKHIMKYSSVCSWVLGSFACISLGFFLILSRVRKRCQGKKQTWWLKMIQQPRETSKFLSLGYDNLKFILPLIYLRKKTYGFWGLLAIYILVNNTGQALLFLVTVMTQSALKSKHSCHANMGTNFPTWNGLWAALTSLWHLRDHFWSGPKACKLST